MTNSSTNRGLSLIELMVVLVMSSIVLGSLFTMLGKQRRQTQVSKMKAELESMAQISFFIIGRDIRRAGSNPKGWGAFTAGEPISFEVATQDRVIIRADLNGNGTVETDTDERIIYEFIDDPDNPDGVKDQIRRQSGNALVIENVEDFALCYWMIGNYWDCNPSDTAIIKKVRMTLKARTGKVNPATGKEDVKEIQTIIRPRNFDL